MKPKTKSEAIPPAQEAAPPATESAPPATAEPPEASQPEQGQPQDAESPEAEGQGAEQGAGEETTTPTKPGVKEITNIQRVIDANLVNALRPFVSTDPSRHVLGGIFFGHDDTGNPIAVATNGRALAMAEQLIVDADEYPMFPNGGAGQDSKDEVIMPVKPLLDALRKVPKKTTLPILMTPPLISLKNDKGEVVQACVPVTDLDSYTLETTRVIDGHFPRYQQVIPPESATAIEIEIDANRLLDIAQAALAFCKNGNNGLVPVKLCVPFESHGPLRCEVKDKQGRRLTMVIMPLKDGGELVNRIEHRGLVAVTERLEAAATVLEAIGQKKTRRPAETMKQAA